jgi:hypothetical protein
MTMLSAREVAEKLGITRQAVSDAARKGRFGDTVKRNTRNEYQFDWPAAGAEFKKNTDPTRYSAARMAAAHGEPTEPTVDVVVYEGPNGRVEISPELSQAIDHAVVHPDADLVTPEIAAALDQILFAKGITGSDHAE